ncbi:MAG: hypothetical protein ACLQNV_09545 [Steroidobacteraceae bacterium]
MNIIPIKDVSFDDTATLAMDEAFDHACASLHSFGTLITARELIAKRIIEAAKNGERDPVRLYEQSLIPFDIEDMSMLVVSVVAIPHSQPMLRSRSQRVGRKEIPCASSPNRHHRRVANRAVASYGSS